MSVANIVMCEFKDASGIQEFCDWYKEHGSFPDNTISLWVQTGEKTAISINVYPTEEARANADKIRDENTATKGFRETLHDIVPISGTVMVSYLNNTLVEE